VPFVANDKNLPLSYGFLGLFLGTVSLVSGIVGGNTLYFGLGGASLAFGVSYLTVVRRRPRG